MPFYFISLDCVSNFFTNGYTNPKMTLSCLLFIVNDYFAICKRFTRVNNILKLFMILYPIGFFHFNPPVINIFFNFHEKKDHCVLAVAYADITFLPLRRRLAKTLRPFFVLMRERNPCTFLRLRLFG